MKNKIRLKNFLKAFESYSADEVSYNYRLNANEFPYSYKDIYKLTSNEKRVFKSLQIDQINRYPDPIQTELRKNVLNFHNLPKHGVIFGNGSDELILYILLTLTGKTSKVLYFEPSFSMYKILTKGLGLKGVGIPLSRDFKLDVDKALNKISQHDPDIIFIASPNNPTGNAFIKEDIVKIINAAKGIVVIDEAYIDYSAKSLVGLLKNHKNLLIMKTMSKIGFASLRLGYLIGSKEVISCVDKLRLPYNISMFTQVIANRFFKKPSIIKSYIEQVKSERKIIQNFMEKIPEIKFYDSDSNFILIELKKSKELFNFFKKNNLIVKSFFNDKRLKYCLRLTVGSSKENKKLLSLMKVFFHI